MRIILAWYPNPDPDNIDMVTWSGFLDSYVPVLLILILAFIALIVILYRRKASHFKIHSVEDVFHDYTPLNALWWGVAGALLSAILAALMYWNMVQVMKGMLGFALTMLLLTLLICELASYLIVAYARGLTPPQFCYRPGRLFHKRRTAR